MGDQISVVSCMSVCPLMSGCLFSHAAWDSKSSAGLNKAVSENTPVLNSVVSLKVLDSHCILRLLKLFSLFPVPYESFIKVPFWC